MADTMTKRRIPLSEMAAQAGGGEPQFIAGKSAAACPYCGCGMYVYKTTTRDTRIVRYEKCRNLQCGKRFVTRQGPAEIVREIDDE